MTCDFARSNGLGVSNCYPISCPSSFSDPTATSPAGYLAGRPDALIKADGGTLLAVALGRLAIQTQHSADSQVDLSLASPLDNETRRAFVWVGLRIEVSNRRSPAKTVDLAVQRTPLTGIVFCCLMIAVVVRMRRRMTMRRKICC